MELAYGASRSSAKARCARRQLRPVIAQLRARPFECLGHESVSDDEVMLKRPDRHTSVLGNVPQTDAVGAVDRDTLGGQLGEYAGAAARRRWERTSCLSPCMGAVSEFSCPTPRLRAQTRMDPTPLRRQSCASGLESRARPRRCLRGTGHALVTVRREDEVAISGWNSLSQQTFGSPRKTGARLSRARRRGSFPARWRPPSRQVRRGGHRPGTGAASPAVSASEALAAGLLTEDRPCGPIARPGYGDRGLGCSVAGARRDPCPAHDRRRSRVVSGLRPSRRTTRICHARTRRPVAAEWTRSGAEQLRPKRATENC